MKNPLFFSSVTYINKNYHSMVAKMKHLNTNIDPFIIYN